MATNLSRKLHAVFVEAANEVRNRLGQANIPNFHLNIGVDGRTLSDADECKITYKIGDSYYSNTVEGNDLEVCLVEFMRRHGWDETHKPLALAKPRKSKRSTTTNWADENEDEYGEAN